MTPPLTASKSATLRVKPVETTYEVRGSSLKRAIEASGLTQAELSSALGFTSGAYLCRLCKSDKTRLSSSTLDRIARILSRRGVTIDGMLSY